MKPKLLLIAILALLWWFLRRPRPEATEMAGQAEIRLPEATAGKPFTQRAAAPSRYQDYPAPPPDDLTRIYGIGPKIASVLNAAGITTFAQLYETGAERVGELLDAAGIPLAQPETWMEQARLAASGDFELLDKHQDEMKAQQ